MKQALELMKTIEAHGYEAYIIGGFPRDLYLGRNPTELDLCTAATEVELSPFLEIKSNHYGSMKVAYQGLDYDITTFRTEQGSLDHRHPETVTFVKTLSEDLLRRDFTINTLAINSQGDYVDLLGARVDLDQKIIRTVGDPFKKLEEDALRILRAFRFAVVLGFTLEESLKQAIDRKKEQLAFLSKERIRQELKKMVESNAASMTALFTEFACWEVLGLSSHALKENDWMTFLIQCDPNQLYWTKKEKNGL